MGWVYDQWGMQASLGCCWFPGCVPWSMELGEESLGLDGLFRSHPHSIRTPGVLLKESEQVFGVTIELLFPHQVSVRMETGKAYHRVSSVRLLEAPNQ